MFVTFEGPEGGGKSTLIQSLAAGLQGQNREVVVTREPGAGPVGASIREILLHGDHLDPKAELFLFLADRAQHVSGLIRPALERGAWVLCDRHADSTVVYQGYGRGLDLDQLRAWNRFATGGLVPDVTFLLDLDPSAGLARIAAKDRLDAEPLEFHRRIRNGFLSEARLDPTRWVVLDASRPAAEVLLAAESALKNRAG
ncbi:MAG TPA: dTMP kinase [Fimbriimonadaceae bacterium]|nr:dTMP kinase [Fimbriimonadaceae bacterium]